MVQGLRKNDIEVVQWYHGITKAVKAGDANAQFKLAYTHSVNFFQTTASVNENFDDLIASIATVNLGHQ